MHAYLPSPSASDVPITSETRAMSADRRHHSESLHRYQAGTKSSTTEGNSLLSSQLTLELRLEQDCKDLLHLYKETQDWSAVGQLAQSLTTCSSRICELKKRLKDLDGKNAPLPFLEKISESDSKAYHAADQVGNCLKPLETIEGVSNPPSTKLDGEEEDKPNRPEQTRDSLPKTSSVQEISVNKLQSITKLRGFLL